MRPNICLLDMSPFKLFQCWNGSQIFLYLVQEEEDNWQCTPGSRKGTYLLPPRPYCHPFALVAFLKGLLPRSNVVCKKISCYDQQKQQRMKSMRPKALRDPLVPLKIPERDWLGQLLLILVRWKSMWVRFLFMWAIVGKLKVGSKRSVPTGRNKRTRRWHYG